MNYFYPCTRIEVSKFIVFDIKIPDNNLHTTTITSEMAILDVNNPTYVIAS